MRFQKRISLGKGLRLNLSKSGMGFSFGMPGFSTSIGPRGSFLNVGIPGTGLSNRIPLSGQRNATHSSNHDFSKVSITMDGQGTLSVRDEYGKPLDDSLLRKLKRTDFYKETIKSLNQDLFNKIEKEKEDFIEIYKDTPKIVNDNDWLKELSRIEIEISNKKSYSYQEPTEEECRKKLLEDATKKIHSIFFWTNTRKRQDYVNEHLSEYFSEQISDYEKAKEVFNNDEEKRIKDLLNQKSVLVEKILPGDTEFILNSMNILLQNFSLPIDFSLDYQLSPENILEIDIDLPEIEDLPHSKASILKTGKISIKNKTQTELKAEYAKCVCGLAFYFSGHFFNISPKISTIIVSGYTQRIEKKTGQMRDDYIFSIKVDRTKVEQINFKMIDPIESFKLFEHQLSLKTNFEMKTITPF
jgi:hypothetical protein